MNKKILIVDDEKIIIHLTTIVLKKRGCEIVSCANAEEALSLVEKERPDLIILDHLLPGKNGLELCQEVKLNPQTSLIPVLITTGQKLNLEDQILEQKLLKPDRILSKPFEIDELLKIVEELLPIKRLA